MTTSFGRDPAFAASPSSPVARSRPDGLQSGVGFTPGPWACEFFEPIGYPPEYPCFHLGQQSDEGQGLSGTILEGDLVLANNDENEANARLLAAAPDLYDTLCTLETALARDVGNGYAGVALIQAVLAKVNGEA